MERQDLRGITEELIGGQQCSQQLPFATYLQSHRTVAHDEPQAILDHQLLVARGPQQVEHSSEPVCEAFLDIDTLAKSVPSVHVPLKRVALPRPDLERLDDIVLRQEERGHHRVQSRLEERGLDRQQSAVVRPVQKLEQLVRPT